MANEDITKTALFAQAAAEARIASRRYWAKGGAADKEYPMLPTPGWFIPLVDGDKRVKDSIKRHRGEGEKP